MTKSLYKVAVNKTLDWKDRDYEYCSLDISLGNPKTTGDKFRSLVDWANKRFPCCVINLGDILYRHNLNEFIYDKELAFQRARRIGDDWIEQNREAINNLSIPHRIERWEIWLDMPDFVKAQESLWDFYYVCKNFRRVLDHDVKLFQERKSLTETGYIPGKQNCLNYILEELAVYNIKGKRAQKPVARVYPSSNLLSASYLANENVPDELIGFKNEVFIKVDFKRKNLQNISARELKLIASN
jgi:tRNA-dependent cyclodipeptide synthase